MNEIIEKIIAFRDERGWGKFHNPKDLAISISLEASELLEHFQWKSSDEALANIEKIKEELADVMIYSLLLSHELGIEIMSTIEGKIKKNAAKYPVDKAFGSNKKYTDLR